MTGSGIGGFAAPAQYAIADLGGGGERGSRRISNLEGKPVKKTNLGGGPQD